MIMNLIFANRVLGQSGVYWRKTPGCECARGVYTGGYNTVEGKIAPVKTFSLEFNSWWKPFMYLLDHFTEF